VKIVMARLIVSFIMRLLFPSGARPGEGSL